ncbi:MAG: hypothetical protein A3H45_04890 [Ignavibacteria bacterium RIFCSPLOWO2_02_FULL_55_14]|nr:MAG: hypothetical protein A3H45_04890 [Ignavibacteria bacterium RIFCSPLOWO2_02_FULL_55_14]
MIERLLGRPEVELQPPVLVDIGASGHIHPIWAPIARYSVCIAFDADDRELAATRSESSGFLRRHVIHSVVSSSRKPMTKFYLTHSPFCSSTLVPDSSALSEWAFADSFTVERVAQVRSRMLAHVLEELGLENVDWFKTDAQGIDVRLFQSLPVSIRRKVLVADFEPGIMDAYAGEDKLHELMKGMERSGFWMSDLDIRGSQRIRLKDVEGRLSRFHLRYLHHLVKTSPGWGEVSYMNSFGTLKMFSLRDMLVACTFAIVKGQYGFVIRLAGLGRERFGDPLFEEVERYAVRKIRYAIAGLPFMAARKLIERLLARLR